MQVFQLPRKIQSTDIPPCVMNVLRPPTYLRDLEYRVGEGKFLLWKPDIDALLDVILMVLNSLPRIPQKGSLAIKWEADSGASEWVMRANLAKGTSIGVCDYIAEAIEQTLHSAAPAFVGYSTERKDCQTLLIRTNRGRFAITIRLSDRIRESEQSDYERIITLAIAATLARLRLHDKTLQDSIEYLRKVVFKGRGSKACRQIFGVIDNLFENGGNSTIKFWYDEYFRATQQGLLWEY